VPEFIDIAPIDDETTKMIESFGGQKNPGNDSALAACIKKWQKDAEDNNAKFEGVVKMTQGALKQHMDTLEKNVEAVRAAAKKNAPLDWKVLTDIKKIRLQVTEAATKLHESAGALYTANAKYRANVWRNAAKDAFSTADKIQPFDKLRKDGIDRSVAVMAQLERIDEYEERAAHLMDEAGDTIIAGMKDKKEKEAKVRERVTDLLAQIRERVSGISHDGRDGRQAGIVVDSSAARSIIDGILTQPPSALEASFLPGRIIPQERSLKKAKGKLKTLEMQVEHVKRLTKGLESKFANELKEIKDALKAPTKQVEEFEKWVAGVKPKVEAYLKKAPKA
jgi:hypothetical protein